MMTELTKALLVGEWSLKDFIIVRDCGEAFRWPGEQSGTLIYTENGYVSVAQNRTPLPNPSTEDKQRVSNFYTGTYELDLVNQRVYHTPIQSSVPENIGERMERHLTLLPDGRLKITGKGLKEEVVLIWGKISRSTASEHS